MIDFLSYHIKCQRSRSIDIAISDQPTLDTYIIPMDFSQSLVDFSHRDGMDFSEAGPGPVPLCATDHLRSPSEAAQRGWRLSHRY